MITEDNEVPLGEVLSGFLDDEGLCDVSLQGTDGVRVPANRFILARRSKVFRQMLLGQFSESTKKIVPIGFKGSVLGAVVEYIHTDSAGLLGDLKRNTSEGSLSFDKVSAVISVGSAAAYFNLPGLSQKVLAAISQEIKKNPSWSFSFLEACRSQGPEVHQTLSELALDSVRRHCRAHLSTAAVGGLSPSVLEEILKDEKMQMTEADVFKFLQLWTEGNPEARTATAQTLAKTCVRLERIDPVTLSEVVASSGLVEEKLISEAYKCQALFSNEEMPGLFQRLRSPVVWQNSNSTATAATCATDTELEMLTGPPLDSGIHQWTLELTEESKIFYCSFGIVSTGVKLRDNLQLLRQPGGWIVNTGGYAYRAGKSENQRFAKVRVGSTMTFTLNLLSNCEGNGTLTYKVRAGRHKVLFSNLREHLDKHPGGFVPAVSSSHPARVTLLNIEKLPDDYVMD